MLSGLGTILWNCAPRHRRVIWGVTRRSRFDSLVELRKILSSADQVEVAIRPVEYLWSPIAITSRSSLPLLLKAHWPI
jgi:hypothetical protein